MTGLVHIGHVWILSLLLLTLDYYRRELVHVYYLAILLSPCGIAE